MQKSPLRADEKLNSPLTSENLPRKRKTLRILNILKKNSLRADEKLNSPLTSENLPRKKKYFVF